MFENQRDFSFSEEFHSGYTFAILPTDPILQPQLSTPPHFPSIHAFHRRLVRELSLALWFLVGEDVREKGAPLLCVQDEGFSLVAGHNLIKIFFLPLVKGI